ncbi:MAG: hypothetical protein BWK76_23555 [Desulfobulbaceae bacterium A2]|nr:MAG: hypothetical protein BWK76_23555 [Desulfobulbaceae bacterium A2]
MKRSRTITLTLLASVAVSLTACKSVQETKRELYNSRDRCVEDWGTGDKCEPSGAGGGYYGPHYYWHSSGRPYYYPSGASDPQPVSHGRFASMREGSHSSHSTGTVKSSVSRGGFGHSSSSHSSGS